MKKVIKKNDSGVPVKTENERQRRWKRPAGARREVV